MRVAGKHPAIDIGARTLRQRIVGVAAIQPRRNAGGAQHRVIGRVLRDDGVGLEVVGVGDKPQSSPRPFRRRSASPSP